MIGRGEAYSDSPQFLARDIRHISLSLGVCIAPLKVYRCFEPKDIEDYLAMLAGVIVFQMNRGKESALGSMLRNSQHHESCPTFFRHTAYMLILEVLHHLTSFISTVIVTELSHVVICPTYRIHTSCIRRARVDLRALLGLQRSSKDVTKTDIIDCQKTPLLTST